MSDAAADPACPAEQGGSTAHRKTIARDRNEDPREEPAITTRIFVGNLTFGITADALTALLSEAGSVVEVYLPADRETGRPRGFAFVQFASEPEAATAIQLFHDREVEGRKLTVNAAEDRPSRPGGSRPFETQHAGAGRDRPAPGRSFKRKGSRRGLRGRKRSL